MLQPLFKNNRRVRSLFAAALIAYILLFSAFSLFHAYSENELVDSHGCAIGLSVSHGQALLPMLIALAIVLIPRAYCPIPRRLFLVQLFSLQRAIRAPPQQFSFC